jgi:hypothetical protein
MGFLAARKSGHHLFSGECQGFFGGSISNKKAYADAVTARLAAQYNNG